MTLQSVATGTQDWVLTLYVRRWDLSSGLSPLDRNSYDQSKGVCKDLLLSFLLGTNETSDQRYFFLSC